MDARFLARKEFSLGLNLQLLARKARRLQFFDSALPARLLELVGIVVLFN